MFSRGYRSEILLQNGLEKTKGKKQKLNNVKFESKNAATFYPGKINLTKAARSTLTQNSSTPPYLMK